MVDLNGKKILVTGGRGFIGTNFIKLVDSLYKDVEIHNIDKHGAGSCEGLEDIVSFTVDGYVWMKGISINGNKIVDIFGDVMNSFDFGYWDIPTDETTYDYIFNFAAESHVDRSIETPSEFILNNVISISKLLEWVKVKQPQAKIIHISTDEVYGHLGLNDPAFTEDTPLSPRSPYAASKAASDLVALSYHRTYNINVCVTRCCNNYGPYQDGEKFIPTILRSLYEGNKIPVYGNGANVREWIYVDDHNKSILEIADIGAAGMVYNISSGVEMSNLDLITEIIKWIYGTDDITDYIKYVEDRLGHDFRYSLESKNYKRNFEVKSFSDGIAATINHYNTKYTNE